MNLILHLTPEIEARLSEQAKAEGKPLEEFVLEALQDKVALQAESPQLLSKQARVTKFRELIASMPDGNPDADVSRKAAYGNRGQ